MWRGTRRASVLAIIVTVGIGMVACVGGDPLPTLPPTPDTTPIFASEEEALAAAEDAYVAYQAAVDDALTTLDDSALASVATGAALEGALQSVSQFSSGGRRQTGLSRVASATAVDLSGWTEPSQDTTVQMYACLDLSQVKVVAEDGTTQQSALAVLPMLVTLVASDETPLVSEEEVWSGENFCG